MSTPVRLQLSRRKGFDLQALSRSVNGLDAVNVARPGRFGNPWSIQIMIDEAAAFEGIPLNREGAQRQAVATFEDWLHGAINPKRSLGPRACTEYRASLPMLRGRNLACWCKPSDPCHADVLLKLANGPR